MITPWRREIFQAGPSSDKSTSIWLSLVARPNVICQNIQIQYIAIQQTYIGNVKLCQSLQMDLLLGISAIEIISKTLRILDIQNDSGAFSSLRKHCFYTTNTGKHYLTVV